MTIDKEELLDFLRENLTIHINRHQDYHSYPHIEVMLKFDGQLIDSDQCTIYDGERSD